MASLRLDLTSAHQLTRLTAIPIPVRATAAGGTTSPAAATIAVGALTVNRDDTDFTLSSSKVFL